MVLTVTAPGRWCWVGPGPLIAHSEGGSVSVGFQVTFCIASREVGSSEIFIFIVRQIKMANYDKYKNIFSEEKYIFSTSFLGFNYFSNGQ